MSDSVTIDTSRFQQVMEQLHDALIGAGRAGDAATIVEDEARLWLKQIIRLTPPTRYKRVDESGARIDPSARKTGEAAIERELRKIFTPVNADMADDLAIEHGTNALDVWMTTAGGEKKHLKWDRIDASGTGMKSFHHESQMRNGRTLNLKSKDKSAWYAAYVVTYEDFNAYLKKQQAKVGRRKAAWAVGYQRLGGSVTRWISKHVGGAKGACQNDLLRVGNPSVTVANFSSGIRDDERICRDALRIRMKAMASRMRLILSGYSKDVVAHMKVSRKAKPSPVEVAE